MRIGFGYDVHKLVKNRQLVLGGEKILYEKGLLGHSDADVIIHSIMDSIIGALAMGDIGKFFPDTDPSYKDISSIILLEKVYEILTKKGYKIGNIDVTVACEKPKLRDYIDNMRKNISDALKTDILNISIKATTTEGLGFVGNREGISAYCVCLIKPL